MAQWVRNLSAVQETQEMWVQSLGWEDPLEKGITNHPLQYSCLENRMDRGNLADCRWYKWERQALRMQAHRAAAAKLLQLYPTLCDPIDGSPPGSPIPGIL